MPSCPSSTPVVGCVRVLFSLITFIIFVDELLNVLVELPVHVTKLAVPSVPLVPPSTRVALPGSAIPSVSDVENPNTPEPEAELQNLPKLSPLPGRVEVSFPLARPGCVASAAFAISTSAMYAYQLPSVACSILILSPFMVTEGSPCPSSSDEMALSTITTSITIGPEKTLDEVVLSADTKRFALWAALACGNTPGKANVNPPANIIVISVRLVSFLTISFVKHGVESFNVYKVLVKSC